MKAATPSSRHSMFKMPSGRTPRRQGASREGRRGSFNNNAHLSSRPEVHGCDVAGMGEDMLDLVTCIPALGESIGAEQKLQRSAATAAFGHHFLHQQPSGKMAANQRPAQKEEGIVHFVPTPATLTVEEKALAERMWHVHLPDGTERLTSTSNLLALLVSMHLPSVNILEPHLERILKHYPNQSMYWPQFLEFLVQCKTFHSLRHHRQKFNKKREWLKESIARYHAHHQGCGLASREYSHLLDDGSPRIPAREELYNAFCSIAELTASGSLFSTEGFVEDSMISERPTSPDGALNVVEAVPAGAVVEWLVNFDLQPTPQLQDKAPGTLDDVISKKQAAAAQKRKKSMAVSPAPTTPQAQQQPGQAQGAPGNDEPFSAKQPQRRSLHPGSPTNKQPQVLSFEEFVDLVLTPMGALQGTPHGLRAASPSSKKRRLLQTRLSSFGLLRNDLDASQNLSPTSALMAKLKRANGAGSPMFPKPGDEDSFGGKDGPRHGEEVDEDEEEEEDDDLITETSTDVGADPNDSAIQDILKAHRRDVLGLGGKSDGDGGAGGDEDRNARRRGNGKRSKRRERTLLLGAISSGGTLDAALLSEAKARNTPEKKVAYQIGPGGHTHAPELATSVEKQSKFSTHRLLPSTYTRFMSQRGDASATKKVGSKEAKASIGDTSNSSAGGIHETLNNTTASVGGTSTANLNTSSVVRFNKHTGMPIGVATKTTADGRTKPDMNETAMQLGKLAKENTKGVVAEAENLLQKIMVSVQRDRTERQQHRQRRAISSAQGGFTPAFNSLAATPMTSGLNVQQHLSASGNSKTYHQGGGRHSGASSVDASMKHTPSMTHLQTGSRRGSLQGVSPIIGGLGGTDDSILQRTHSKGGGGGGSQPRPLSVAALSTSNQHTNRSNKVTFPDITQVESPQ